MAEEDEDNRGSDGAYRVDPGALAVGVVVVGIGFLLGDGDWGLSAWVVGILLLIYLLAYYRHSPTLTTPRDFLIRAAFGASVALAICIVAGPVLQWGLYWSVLQGEGQAGLDRALTWTNNTLWTMFFPVSLVLIRREQHIMQALDRPITGKMWTRILTWLAPPAPGADRD
jgi:hypothetical protein